MKNKKGPTAVDPQKHAFYKPYFIITRPGRIRQEVGSLCLCGKVPAMVGGRYSMKNGNLTPGDVTTGSNNKP